MMNRRQQLKTIDGINLSSIHTISKGKGVILWVHGISANKDESLGLFKDGAEYCASKGIDSLRIDFRGHGESGGTSLDFTITGQMLDIESAIAFLSRKYDLLKTGLNIVGCSFGCPAAIFAAIRHPDIIKNVVLLIPLLSYQRTILAPEREWAQAIFTKKAFSDLSKTKKIYINEQFPVGIRLIEEMRLIQPDIAIRQVSQNLTIIHGDCDQAVPFAVTQKVAKENPKINFFPIKGMIHGFMNIGDDEGKTEKSLKNKQHIFDIIYNQCKPRTQCFRRGALGDGEN